MAAAASLCGGAVGTVPPLSLCQPYLRFETIGGHFPGAISSPPSSLSSSPFWGNSRGMGRLKASPCAGARLAPTPRQVGVISMVVLPGKDRTALPLPPPPVNRLHDLYNQGGQSPWIDNLTRDWAASGHLEELVRRGVRGLTSNPTIFEKAIGGSNVYDEQIREVVRGKGMSSEDAESLSAVEEVYWEIARTDICKAAGILSGLYRESDGGDGFVSLEVSPTLAHDSAGTSTFARSLHQRLQLPNLMVKIPATKEGLPAIREMISEGRSINVTLIFSLQRYADVIEAYISGLEALAASPSPSDLSKVASVASFFISRVDTVVDARLDALGTPEAAALKGKAAVAQGVMAYQLFMQTFKGPRWEKLAEKGARVQRPLWASTGVKSPAYPDTMYVDELIGPATVNTMPDSTLLAFADHGTVKRTVDANVEAAKKVLDGVAALGIDMEDVAQELEVDGVKKFDQSFTSLLQTLQQKVRSMA